MSVTPALWNSLDIRNGATPITAVPSQLSDEPSTLKKLLDTGVLTSAISAKPSFVYGGTTNALPKKMDGPGPTQTSEFSRKDAEIWGYTMWQRKEKIGKGSLSAKVYDARNRLRVEAAPRKVALLDSVPTRFAFNFSPRQFELGVYRVDILWDSRPVWRTFISIID
jgi:hypothetical protein